MHLNLRQTLEDTDALAALNPMLVMLYLLAVASAVTGLLGLH